MRVLLISPLRGLDPPNGDVSYTEELLASPPNGVEYVTYREALASGELHWVGARESLRPPGVRWSVAMRALVARKVHRWLAQAGVVFREPPLTARVTGSFDIVHVHAFNVGFVGPHPPIAYSNACPTATFYGDYEGWSARRVRFAGALQGQLAVLGRSKLVSSHPLPDATWVLFSEFLVRHYVQMGVDPLRVFVVPNSIRGDTPTVARRRDHVVGFSARSFEGKGGPLVLEAFAAARLTLPEIELEMVGHERPDGVADSEGVRWLGGVDRNELVEEILPTWGALVYPTSADGVPYAVIEALAAGCPTVTVPYGAIPEMVPHGVAGWVAPALSSQALADGIVAVLDRELHDRLSAGARSWFESHYSASATGPLLLAAYDAAIAHGNGQT